MAGSTSRNRASSAQTDEKSLTERLQRSRNETPRHRVCLAGRQGLKLKENQVGNKRQPAVTYNGKRGTL